MAESKRGEMTAEIVNQRRERRANYMVERRQTLWDMFEPEWVAHMLGISLKGLTGEEAKKMLRRKKVWPYYYYAPNDLTDWDRFPTELLPEPVDKEEQEDEEDEIAAEFSQIDQEASSKSKNANKATRNIKNKLSVFGHFKRRLSQRKARKK